MGGYRGGCPEARSMEERAQEVRVGVMYMVIRESIVTDGTVLWWEENVLLDGVTRHDGRWKIKW